MDYANGKIYRIICEETGRQYIGSTCSTLVKRLSNHKRSNKNNCKPSSCKDFINPKIFLIEDYPCDRKEQLLMRERFHMENNECVNLNRPIITREEFLQHRRNYNTAHREERLEHYQTHKEEIRQNAKEKFTCECGCVIQKTEKARHRKSKKHQKLLGGVEL